MRNGVRVLWLSWVAIAPMAQAGSIVTARGRTIELRSPPVVWGDTVLLRIGDAVIPYDARDVDVARTRAIDTSGAWSETIDAVASLQARSADAARFSSGRRFSFVTAEAALLDGPDSTGVTSVLPADTAVEIHSERRTGSRMAFDVSTQDGRRGWVVGERARDIIRPDAMTLVTTSTTTVVEEAPPKPIATSAQSEPPAQRPLTPVEPTPAPPAPAPAPAPATPPTPAPADGWVPEGNATPAPAPASEPTAQGDWTPGGTMEEPAQSASIVPTREYDEHPIRQNKFKKRGAKIGAIAGGVLGFLIGHDVKSAAVGAAAGSLIGLGIGAIKDNKVKDYAQTAHDYGWEPSDGYLINIESFDGTPSVPPGGKLDLRVKFAALGPPQEKLKIGAVLGVYQGAVDAVKQNASSVGTLPVPGGGTFERTFTLDIPRDLPPGTYDVMARFAILGGNDDSPTDTVAKLVVQVAG